MGLHVLVGMEDTTHMYSHRPILIRRSSEVVAWTGALTRLLGREPITATEYRAMLSVTEPAK